jgi:methyl-accepting chemotaxis protein
VNQVTSLMGQIAGATREQRDGVQAVSHAVEEIGTATQYSAAAVRRSNEAAAALRTQAKALEDAVAAFNLKAQD